MKYTLIFTFLLLISAAQAQTTLPSGNIEVVKDFEVRLAETKKIRIVPQPVAIDSTIRQYEYKLLAPSPTIEYQIPELKPLAIQAEKKPTYYPFYTKVGYGNPNSLLAMASYDHVQNEKFQWGADVRHLRANNKKIPLQKFSDTRARLNGTYLLKENIIVDGYLDGHAETVYFYGADPIPNNEESLKRLFNRYDLYVSLAKPYAPESSLNYKAFLQYMTDKDDLGSRERGLKAGGEINSKFGGVNPLGISALADLSTLNHTESYHLNNILVRPYIGYFIGDLELHIGGLALLSNQGNEILPDLEFSFRGGSSSLFTLFAGWKGTVEKNNFHFLSTYNPYISTRIDSLTNTISRRMYAGFKGGSGSTSYELTGSYTRFEGMAFFLQNEEIPEQFLPVYDNGSYIGIEGSIRLQLLKHIYLRGQLSQRFFSLDQEAKPWHRPSLGIRSQITYTGEEDQFHVSVIFNGENGLPYRTVGGTERTLDALIDLSLHGDYYFSKAFGAFVEVNNVLGNNRERWATYPTYGFNAKAGFMCRIQ